MNSNEDIIDGIIGEIRMVAFDFAPQGWLLCDGRTLNIAQYQTLFVLIGTKYGGDGKTTFALPDLRGRMPIGSGDLMIGNTNIAYYPLGGSGGQTSATLADVNLPAHDHELKAQTLQAAIDIFPQATSSMANTDDPTNAVWGNTCDQNNQLQNSFSTATANLKNMYPIKISANIQLQAKTASTGSSLPFKIMNPYLALNFIICVNGIFPARP